MKQIAFRSGNSLAVTVPARLVRSLGLQPGAVITSQINYYKKTITFSFPGSGQMSLLPPRK